MSNITSVVSSGCRVFPAGFEPATQALGGLRSVHLSYGNLSAPGRTRTCMCPDYPFFWFVARGDTGAGLRAIIVTGMTGYFTGFLLWKITRARRPSTRMRAIIEVATILPVGSSGIEPISYPQRPARARDGQRSRSLRLGRPALCQLSYSCLMDGR